MSSGVVHRPDPDELMERLRSFGARHTPARQWVLELLAESAGHLSAAEIHRRVANDHAQIDVATVHRTLDMLAAHDLVHVLPVPGEGRYGLADVVHHHVICSECGAVQELPVDALPDIGEAAERATGYRIDTALTLFGQCPTCR